MAFALSYPLVNGHRYSFASIEAFFNGVKLPGWKSINYSAELAPGEMYANAPHMLGRTRGKHKVTADAEIYRLEWEVFVRACGVAGVGYGETSSNITVVYWELFSSSVTDVIEGARITKVEHSNTEGTDPTTVKVTFSALNLMENGACIISPFAPK